MTITEEEMDYGISDDAAIPAARRRRPPRRKPRPRGQLARRTPTPPAENYYPDVYLWVEDWLSEVYAHEQDDQIREFRWCPDWWCHAAAVTRLEAAWKAWEKLRNDPGTGASVWFRDHGDPCMRALTEPDGPFTRCSPTRHHQPTPLATSKPSRELSDPTVTMPR